MHKYIYQDHPGNDEIRIVQSIVAHQIETTKPIDSVAAKRLRPTRRSTGRQAYESPHVRYSE